IHIMNIETDLILIKQEDKTDKIESCVEKNNKVHVKFKGRNKVFPYNKENVIRFSNPELFDGSIYTVYENGVALQKVKKTLHFEQYYRIIFNNGQTSIYPSATISLEETAPSNPSVKKKFTYFTDLSANVGPVLKDGSRLLKNYFDKI